MEIKGRGSEAKLSQTQLNLDLVLENVEELRNKNHKGSKLSQKKINVLKGANLSGGYLKAQDRSQKRSPSIPMLETTNLSRNIISTEHLLQDEKIEKLKD